MSSDPTPTDPIERAKAVAADALDGWRACEEHRTLEDLAESIGADLSAAGLLAATPAQPAGYVIAGPDVAAVLARYAEATQ